MQKRTRIPVFVGSSVMLALLVSLGATIFVSSHVKGGQVPAPAFVRHPLTGATPEEIGRAALDYVHTNFAIRSGTPQVALSRFITEDDLPALGLGRVSFAASQHPPLALVILKGDFGQANIMGTGNKPDDHFAYVGYVYDLWAGTPTKTIASTDGAVFRQALNDATLPIGATIPAGPPEPTSSVFIPYGSTLPTVTRGQIPPAPTPLGKVSPRP